MTESTNYAKLTPEKLTAMPVITQPGTYSLKVKNTSREVDSMSPINEGGTAKIISFEAIFKQEVPTLTQLMSDALSDGEEGINYEDAGNCFANFNLESTDPQYINAPVKGETLDVIVEKVKVENKSGLSKFEGQEILVVRNIKISAGKIATGMNWDFSTETVATEAGADVEVA